MHFASLRKPERSKVNWYRLKCISAFSDQSCGLGNCWKVSAWMLMILALLSACSTSPGPDAPRGGLAPTTRSTTLVPNAFLFVHRIAIAPIEIPAASSVSSDPRAPSAATNSRGEVTLQARFEALANEVLSFELVQSNALERGASNAQQGTGERWPVEKWRTAAQASGADALLIARLNQYIQRQGSALGAETPARVDLEFSLIRAKDGILLWQGSYHYEDAALLDNLLRVRQKLGDGGAPSWYSAESVFQSGARELLKRLEQERTSAFFSAGK